MSSMSRDDRQHSLAPVARAASIARVPMSHVPGDAEYLPVLAYRVNQEMRATMARYRDLANLAEMIGPMLTVGRDS